MSKLYKLSCILAFLIIADKGYAQAPVISSFSPASGNIGTAVTITGSNFNSTALNNIVFFGATQAEVTSATTTVLTVKVPGGATYQPISVLNVATGLTAYTATGFKTTFAHSKHRVTIADFDPAVAIPNSPQTAVIATGDLDGDGKPEIVAAVGAGFEIYHNISSGSITASSFAHNTYYYFNESQNIKSIIIKDMDGDGKPDIVVSAPGMFAICLNLGGPISDTSFAINGTYPNIGFDVPFSIAVGDIDGDGKPDIVENTGSKIYLLHNSSSVGHIVFNVGNTSVIHTPSAFVTLADVNGDGKPDLVYSYPTTYKGDNVSSIVDIFVRKNISIAGTLDSLSFSNTGVQLTTNFASSFTGAPDYYPFFVKSADIDGDGKLDLIVTNSMYFYILHNTSTVTDITFDSILKVGFAAQNLYSTDVGDIDGDGKPDILVADNSNILVYRNVSVPGNITTASFIKNIMHAGFSSSLSVAIEDIDGDGRSDLLFSYKDNTGLSIMHNHPDTVYPYINSFSPIMGHVGTSVTISGGNFNTSAPGNIVFFGATQANVTSATDTTLTVTVPAGATYQPMSVLNTSNGLSAYSILPFITTFSPNTFHLDPELKIPTGNQPYAVTTSDIDGDGKPDMIVANAGSSTISVYRNVSITGSLTTASFAPKVDLSTGYSSAPDAIITGDIDGDGKPDIITANYHTNNISIFRNISSGSGITTASFAPRVDIATGVKPVSIAMNDIDGDGKPDLAVTNVGDNSVYFYRNVSSVGNVTTSSFISSKISYGRDTPTAITLSDMNGDGKPDWILSDYTSSISSVDYNAVHSGDDITAYSFPTGTTGGTGKNPRAMVTGDLDGDGLPDIITVNKGGYSMSVLQGALFGPAGFDYVGKVDLRTGPSPTCIAIGDVNGDGKPDLIAGNNATNTISGYENRTTPGIFTAGSFYGPLSLTVGNHPTSICISDLDGDGKPDLLISSSGSNIVSIFRNASSGSSTPDNVSLINQENTKTTTDNVLVHAALTPNGDGVNDKLIIDAITDHPDNRMIIVNSKGIKVFDAAGYNNTSVVFDGNSNMDGSRQTAGTYFYKLEYTLNGELKTRTGYIVLKY